MVLNASGTICVLFGEESGMFSLVFSADVKHSLCCVRFLLFSSVNTVTGHLSFLCGEILTAAAFSLPLMLFGLKQSHRADTAITAGGKWLIGK